MKKKSFIRILLLYLLFYVILSAIFAVIYSINADDDIPLKELIMFSFAKSVNCSLDSPITISNNIIMIMCYVATDTKTSSYTKNGMMFFGILVGILTFLNTFIDPILAPLLSVLIVSLLNNLIDRIANKIAESKI